MHVRTFRIGPEPEETVVGKHRERGVSPCRPSTLSAKHPVNPLLTQAAFVIECRCLPTTVSSGAGPRGFAPFDFFASSSDPSFFVLKGLFLPAALSGFL